MAPPAMLVAMAVGLGTIDMPIPQVAAWEWVNWRFPKAVRAGETIYARWTLTQKRPPLHGAQSGIAVWRVDVHTTDGAVCAEGEVGASVFRRTAAPASATAVEARADAVLAAGRRRRRRRSPAGSPAEGATGAATPSTPTTSTTSTTPTTPTPAIAAGPATAATAAPERATGNSRRRRRRRPSGASSGSNGEAPAAPSSAAAPAPAPAPAIEMAAAASPASAKARQSREASPLSRVMKRLRGA